MVSCETRRRRKTREEEKTKNVRTFFSAYYVIFHIFQQLTTIHSTDFGTCLWFSCCCCCCCSFFPTVSFAFTFAGSRCPFGPFGPLEFVQSAGCSFAIGCLRCTAAPKSNLAAHRVVSRLDTFPTHLPHSLAHPILYICICMYAYHACSSVCSWPRVLISDAYSIRFDARTRTGDGKRRSNPFTHSHTRTPAHTHM